MLAWSFFLPFVLATYIAQVRWVADVDGPPNRQWATEFEDAEVARLEKERRWHSIPGWFEGALKGGIPLGILALFSTSCLVITLSKPS